MNIPDDNARPVTRRLFLRDGSLFLTSLAGGLGLLGRAGLGAAESRTPVLRAGLLTDLHYADKPPRGSRHYRDSLKKIRVAVREFRRRQTSVVMELGDFIDAARSVEAELGYLKTINGIYTTSFPDRHYVLGNHCVATLTKRQFLDTCGRDRSYYSFDRGAFHFVVLDACFRPDHVAYEPGNFRWNESEIPPHQRAWLRKDLEATSKPALVFVHQRLDVANDYGIKSASAVRKILSDSGKVLAVFQGHNHVNDHREIGGVHYCTLAAMVERPIAKGNAYSVLEVFAGGSLRVTGFHQQETHSLRRMSRI